jgi:hypothetical protein
MADTGSFLKLFDVNVNGIPVQERNNNEVKEYEHSVEVSQVPDTLNLFTSLSKLHNKSTSLRSSLPYVALSVFECTAKRGKGFSQTGQLQEGSFSGDIYFLTQL